MVPRTSGPASTTALAWRLAPQLAVRTEMEKDSGAVRPGGRSEGGSSLVSPIMMVTGEASCGRVTIRGREPRTLATSLARSSAAFRMGSGSPALSRIVTPGRSVTTGELPFRGMAGASRRAGSVGRACERAGAAQRPAHRPNRTIEVKHSAIIHELRERSFLIGSSILSGTPPAEPALQGPGMLHQPFAFSLRLLPLAMPLAVQAHSRALLFVVPII